MTTYYINPSHTNNGDGDGTADKTGAGGAFNAWTGISWAAGNTYLQARGTTATETVTIGANGTNGSPIILGAYGTGDKPIIDCEDTRADGIYKQGAEYIEIYDFEVQNAYWSGVNDDKTIHAGIYLSQTASASMNGCLVQDCIVRDCGYDGISFMAQLGQTSWLDCTDAKQINNMAYSSGGAGISMRMKSTNGGLIQEGNYSEVGGTVDNQWGVYIQPYSLKQVTTWEDMGSNVYRKYESNGNRRNHPKVAVIFTGRTVAGPLMLTEGSNTTPSANEWYYDSGADYYYINVGQDPTNKSVIIMNARVVGAIQANNKATLIGGGDAVGMGFDHGVEQSYMYGNYSYNNGVGFSTNACLGNFIHNNISYNNSDNGIRVRSVTESVFNPSDRTQVYNNTIINSAVGIGLSNSTRLDIYNNIIIATTDLEVLAPVENEWTDGNNQLDVTTENTTGANLAGNPQLDNNYAPQGDSPCIGAGTTSLSNKDFYGANKVRFNTDIGAVWYDSHAGTTNKKNLASGGNK